MRSWHCWLFVAFAVLGVSAEKTLIYDEEKGIIFVDKDQAGQTIKNEAASARSEMPFSTMKQRLRTAKNGKTVDASIQKGRRKDPPEIYFESGLQYFKNGNFDDALKNFTHADSLDPQPKYMLWMGKTLRQLQKFGQLLFIMNRLVTTYAESDVADDALFEIAFCYQANDDYEMAEKAYTRLAEQYPFGTSYSNGENFRAVAHKQGQMMRSEIISMLKILGFDGINVEAFYSAFQKSKGLAVTGCGNRATVKAIKAAYGYYLKLQEKRALQQARIQKYRAAAFALCALLLVNVSILLMVNRKIAARRKTLAMLTQTLSDLTLGAL